MQQLTMNLGEKRRVSFRITSSLGENFVICDPTYKLQRDCIVEDSGVPEVNGHVLYLFVEPQKMGTYIIECSFWIGGEHLIRKVSLSVEK